MIDPGTPTEQLGDVLSRLRGVITSAKAMPMSASCVVNRAEVLALVDAVERAAPPPRAEPTRVEADRIIAEAREEAARLVSESEVVKAAEVEAERVRAAAQEDASGLRTETDAFVDSRMASFESVLHKQLSQVQLARNRLSQRSRLDEDGAVDVAD
ncbi:hypothetical protein [Microlunatus sp. Y2014]|uniref:hypothetical protein n=1 Tax=Microlunatus sp. Y2014 TaxID=3418488 RepID=UPI003DA749BA